MLQYFSLTENTVFMCLSFEKPGQEGPLPILIYGFLIRPRLPVKQTKKKKIHMQHLSRSDKHVALPGGDV